MVLFCVLTFCISTACISCKKGWRFYESEYYIYSVTESNEVAILGLTDKGIEQEYLVIPETINGKKVYSIGCYSGLEVSGIKETYGDAKYAQFKSVKLRKIFILSDVKMVDGWPFGDFIKKEPPFEAIFYIFNGKDGFYKPKVFFFRTSLKGKRCGLEDIHITGYAYAANTSYDYNYETSPNDGYYWIDNYAYGEKIEYIPENPTREGYTFGGWYKESECVNVWDFEKDALPEIQYDEQGIRVYQETKLYAKWIKN